MSWTWRSSPCSSRSRLCVSLFSWSTGQFQIAHQSRCSFRFTRLRLCVRVVLTLVTSESIDTRHLCALQWPLCVCLMLLFVTSGGFFTVGTLFSKKKLCNLCLFDLNLQGLLHKSLLLLHSNNLTLCCVFLDTSLCFARFVSFLVCDAVCRFSATCS